MIRARPAQKTHTQSHSDGELLQVTGHSVGGQSDIYHHVKLPGFLGEHKGDPL